MCLNYVLYKKRSTYQHRCNALMSCFHLLTYVRTQLGWYDAWEELPCCGEAGILMVVTVLASPDDCLAVSSRLICAIRCSWRVPIMSGPSSVQLFIRETWDVDWFLFCEVAVVFLGPPATCCWCWSGLFGHSMQKSRKICWDNHPQLMV